MAKITKKIWMYWHQGWDDAPALVRQAKDSWITANPEFEVHSLDRYSLNQFIDLNEVIDLGRRDITVQKISALARLALLAKYGGVWSDSTVICTQPVTSWIGPFYSSQFFAFRNPGPDRMMSNWFIAAEPGNQLIVRLNDAVICFFVHNRFSNQHSPLGRQIISFLDRRWNQNLRNTLNWHALVVRKGLRVYPYFIFHYTFNKLILEDPICAKLWFDGKPFSAGPAHLLQQIGYTTVDINKAKMIIDSKVAPMHKLDWRIDDTTNYWSEILRYLGDI